MVEDESDSAPLDGDTDSFVEDITAKRMNSVELEVGSESNITFNQCYVGKEIDAGADTLKDKRIKKVKPQKSALDALKKSGNTLLVEVGDSDSTAVGASMESDYTDIDALGESDNLSIDLPGKPNNPTLDSDLEPDGTAVELGELDSMAINAIGESNNTILDTPVESDNTLVHLLGDSDNAIDVIQESMAMDVLDTTGGDPTSSECDIMDLDIPGAKSRVEMEVREGESIEAAGALYTMSQNHSPQTSGGLGGWQVVNWPRLTRQDDQRGWGSKLSTGIDPKELLQGWDWVFQRK